MTKRTQQAIVLLMLSPPLATMAGCSERRDAFSIPTSPSSPIPVTVGAAPRAIPISVGQTVRATVTLADAPCDLGHGPQPCVRYAIVPVLSGGLLVQLSAPGPNELALVIGAVLSGYGVDRIEGSVRVSEGLTYEVSVALTDAKAGSTSQVFELTTSITP